MHQKIGSLTTMECFRPTLPLQRASFTALAAQLSAALPLHDCGASLLHRSDFFRHVTHHHPGHRRWIVWPPSSGCLATTLVNLRVCGFHWVGEVAVT